MSRRKLYLFVNTQPRPELPNFLECASLTDDGYILGNHICSHESYMIHDLHNAQHRLETITNHYKEPYEIEILSYEDGKNHQGFQSALTLLKQNKRSGI